MYRESPFWALRFKDLKDIHLKYQQQFLIRTNKNTLLYSKCKIEDCTLIKTRIYLNSIKLPI